MGVKSISAKSKSKKVAPKIPVLNCSYLFPTEDEKGLYLIKGESREFLYRIDGYGGEFCRYVDGVASVDEIIAQMAEKYQLPLDEFKSYIADLVKDLSKNGLLTYAGE